MSDDTEKFAALEGKLRAGEAFVLEGSAEECLSGIVIHLLKAGAIWPMLIAAQVEVLALSLGTTTDCFASGLDQMLDEACAELRKRARYHETQYAALQAKRRGERDEKAH